MALEVLKPTEEELSDKAVSQFYEAFYSCIENAKSPLGDFLFNELQQGEKQYIIKQFAKQRFLMETF